MNNRIQTSKYTVFNFLPKNLFYQFMKMSNVYFFVIAILEVMNSLLLNILVAYQANIRF